MITAGRFARSQRLLRSADFESVFARPCRVHSKHLTLLVRTNQLAHARLGLAVAKRIIRQAVDRNRLKRLIRESFRLHQSELPAWDLIVLPKPGAAGADNCEILGQLEQLWMDAVKRCADS